MVPHVQPQAMRVIELLLIARFEQRPPHGGRDDHAGLRGPVVGKVDPVKSVAGGHRHQLAFEVHDQVHQRTELLGCDQEILHRVLETAQERVDRESAQIEAGQPVPILTRPGELRQRRPCVLLRAAAAHALRPLPGNSGQTACIGWPIVPSSIDSRR